MAPHTRAEIWTLALRGTIAEMNEPFVYIKMIGFRHSIESNQLYLVL